MFFSRIVQNLKHDFYQDVSQANGVDNSKELATLKEEIATLKKTVTEKDAVISESLSKINALEETNEDLTSQLLSLEGEVSYLINTSAISNIYKLIPILQGDYHPGLHPIKTGYSTAPWSAPPLKPTRKRISRVPSIPPRDRAVVDRRTL